MAKWHAFPGIPVGLAANVDSRDPVAAALRKKKRNRDKLRDRAAGGNLDIPLTGLTSVAAVRVRAALIRVHLSTKKTKEEEMSYSIYSNTGGAREAIKQILHHIEVNALKDDCHRFVSGSEIGEVYHVTSVYR